MSCKGTFLWNQLLWWELLFGSALWCRYIIRCSSPHTMSNLMKRKEKSWYTIEEDKDGCGKSKPVACSSRVLSAFLGRGRKCNSVPAAMWPISCSKYNNFAEKSFSDKIGQVSGGITGQPHTQMSDWFSHCVSLTQLPTQTPHYYLIVTACDNVTVRCSWYGFV